MCENMSDLKSRLKMLPTKDSCTFSSLNAMHQSSLVAYPHYAFIHPFKR